MQSYRLYIDFIRYAIGSRPTVPEGAERMDWADFLAFCTRQGIPGLVFGGLERSDLRIPQSVLFEWIGIAENTKRTNLTVDKRCHQISRFWEQQGYRSCILKGQANAMMYPTPGLRSPGDIDIWVDGHTHSTDSTDETIDIIRIAQREAPDGHYSLHHVTMPVFPDTSVEVHYRPVFLDNWRKDKKLKRYIDEKKAEQFANTVLLSDGKTEIHGLTDDFNAVFLMLHMWHHLLSTRNNLKQLIDYYYLLKSLTPSPSPTGGGDRGGASEGSDFQSLFKQLGVLKYARGIMWMEHAALGLEEQYLLVEPDEKIGQLLYNETLHYGESRKKKHGKVGTLVSRVTRNLHLFCHFPSPVLIAPAYLVWHQWWKLKTSHKLKHSSRADKWDELHKVNTEL